MKGSLTWEQAVQWLRNQPDQGDLVRTCYFDDPLLEAAARFEASEEWQAVRELIPHDNGCALELGAGRGISSYALAKAGWQVTALEPDPSSLVGRGAIRVLVEQTNLPIHPLDGYAEKLPCRDQQFDLVYGREVMHHAQELQTMCNEVARVLKPGGIFFAAREHVISKKADLPVFLHSHPLHCLYGGENAYLLEEYLGALANAGLRVTHALGPMASAINYFPVSRKEWRKMIQAPIARRIGWRVTCILLSDVLPSSNLINHYLAKMADARSQVPGRLYSFVSIKDAS